MKNESRISVRTLTAMALLIAMSIVFSRVLSISTGFVRFNLGSLPVLLAGILFGPWAGFVVGMVADIIGGVLAGYAINPLITLGAASIGLVGGLGWQKLSHLRTGNRLWCSVLAAHFVGSMVINSLALQSALEDNGVRCKVLTSIRMEPIGEYYSKARAIEYLEAGYVVIVGGGTSNPYFTTDSASALRGIEIEADVMLKGTRVDGVYTADPEKDPAATKFDEITFEEVLDRRLKVMDLTAFTLCRENGLRIIVFDMDTAGNLGKVLAGEKIGTLVKL